MNRRICLPFCWISSRSAILVARAVKDREDRRMFDLMLNSLRTGWGVLFSGL